MKAYVVTTGAVFALLTAVHAWRYIQEGEQVAKDPWFLIITGLSFVFALWAWRVIRQSSK